jgi:predicted lipid-binding transport protein (Tim44 family)
MRLAAYLTGDARQGSVYQTPIVLFKRVCAPGPGRAYEMDVTDTDMQLFDIILFALIAVFLVLRLRGVLGSRDGHEGGYKDIFKPKKNDEAKRDALGRPVEVNDDNVIELPGAHREDVPQAPAIDETFGYEGAIAEGIKAIRATDASFTPKEFLAGSRMAFEMILNAYAAGDLKTLKNLLSSDVYGGFAQAIEDRDSKDQTLQETLVGINAAELMEAYLDGRDATITVKFVSEQISALLDADGTVIEGDPTKVVSATDFWTFARSTKSRNPNWTLVGTGALE